MDGKRIQKMRVGPMEVSPIGVPSKASERPVPIAIKETRGQETVKNRTSLRDRIPRWRAHERAETTAKPLSFAEKLLRSTAVCAAALLCILALKDSNLPIAQKSVAAIADAVTAQVDIEEELGKLTLVKNVLPESMQVFLSAGESLWQWPTSGVVAHAYSAKEPWLTLRSPSSSVLCAFPGTVKNVAKDQNGNKVIVISHSNGWETMYGLLKETDVSQGEKVAVGQQIGQAITQGEQYGVYFEVRHDGKAVSPLDVLPSQRAQ